LSRSPFALLESDIPQFITITIDDAVHAPAADLFRPLTIPRDKRGCGIKATFYVSIEGNTRCEVVQGLRKGLHEMATHTYNHVGFPGVDEIQGAKTFLVNQCGVPADEIKGFRAPLLQWNDATLATLKASGFLYDSSISPTNHVLNEYGKKHIWPFTFSQESIAKFSYNGPTITPHLGLWEIPMWPLYSGTSESIPMDYPGGIPLIDQNFRLRYNGNRAPLGLFFHAGWFQTHGNEMREWIQDIMDAHDDVFFVTSSDLLDWMRNPVPKSEYSPHCEGQVNCLPPSANSCVFGQFNSTTCRCDCLAGYCRDSTGVCGLCAPTPPTPAPGGAPTSGSGPTAQCCPNSFSGNRAFDACKKFYQCDRGRVVATHSCSSGFLFDAGIQNCNWANAVTTCVVDSCGAAAPVPTAPAPTPTAPAPTPTATAPTPTASTPTKCCPTGSSNFHTVDTTCKEYYRCLYGKLSQTFTCSPGTLYVGNGQCNWATQPTCTVVSPSCT